MKIDPETAEASLVYRTMIRAITPRPIAWVSTVSPNGIPNLAPFSYFNGVCSAPAALMFSVVNHPDGSKKDTTRNIESNGQFVVNVVPFELSDQMASTAAGLDYEESEFDAAGLSTAPSQIVSPPRVLESPVHFECEVLQIVLIGEGPLAANVIIGKILLIDVADAVLDSDGKIDPERLDTIGRMGGRDYCRTTERFDMGNRKP